MRPFKDLVSSPKRREERRRQDRKDSISSPIEASSPEESIGLRSPRPAPSPRTPSLAGPSSAEVDSSGYYRYASPGAETALPILPGRPALTGETRAHTSGHPTDQRRQLNRTQSEPVYGKEGYPGVDRETQERIAQTVAMQARKVKLDIARQDYIREEHTFNPNYDESWQAWYDKEDVLRYQAQEAAKKREESEAIRAEEIKRRERRSRKKGMMARAEPVLLQRTSVSTIQEGSTDASRPSSSRYQTTGRSSQSTEFEDTDAYPSYQATDYADESYEGKGKQSAEAWQRTPEEHREMFSESHPARYRSSPITYPQITPLLSSIDAQKWQKEQERRERKKRDKGKGRAP